MKAIEALPRVWVADAHGHPRHVIRVVAPLIDGHAPDGRPSTPYGPHPHWLDGRVHHFEGAQLHPVHQARLRAYRINFLPGTIIARNPGDGTTPPMPCARCQAIGRGFTLEWATDPDATMHAVGRVERRTVALECWVCAHVDRSKDAVLTLSGHLSMQGETERAFALNVLSNVGAWVGPDGETVTSTQDEGSG